MRVTVDGKELKSAIAWGAKGVNKTLGTSASGALALLQLDSGVLTVRSSDGRQSFESRIAVSGMARDESAEVRVFGPDLAAVGSALDSAPVTVDVQDSEVAFILPRSRFSVSKSTVRPGGRPEAPEKRGTISVADFKKAALTVASATDSVAVAMPALGAVHVEFLPEQRVIRLMGTNRVRMVVTDVPYAPADATAEGNHLILVPQDRMRALLMGIPDSADMDVFADDQLFGIGGSWFSGFVNLEDIPPIAYQRLTEIVTDKRFTVKNSDLKSALTKLTSVGANDKVLLTLADVETLILSDASGRQKVEVDIAAGFEILEDDEPVVRFNPTVLTPALAALGTPQVSLAFGDPTKPVMLRETKADGTDSMDMFSMAMPLRQ